MGYTCLLANTEEIKSLQDGGRWVRDRVDSIFVTTEYEYGIVNFTTWYGSIIQNEWDSEDIVSKGPILPRWIEVDEAKNILPYLEAKAVEAAKKYNLCC